MQMEDVYKRGMSAKSMAILLVIARHEGYVVPYKENARDDTPVAKKKAKYTGAIVLDPKIGFYEIPVNVLDFQSLYPSMEIAENLCCTTYVPPHKLHLVPEDKRVRSPPEYTLDGTFLNDGHWFTTKDFKGGIIPRAQERLAARRAVFKAKMGAATDKLEVMRYNIAQNAMKLMMNSIYGFTGFEQATIFCQAVASATTAYGRMYHEKTCKFTESWCAERGLRCLIIYGDTDSLFVTIYSVCPKIDALK